MRIQFVATRRRIASAWDAEAIRRLVATNWIRTAAWTARGVLSLWMLSR